MFFVHNDSAVAIVPLQECTFHPGFLCTILLKQRRNVAAYPYLPCGSVQCTCSKQQHTHRFLHGLPKERPCLKFGFDSSLSSIFGFNKVHQPIISLHSIIQSQLRNYHAITRRSRCAASHLMCARQTSKVLIRKKPNFQLSEKISINHG